MSKGMGKVLDSKVAKKMIPVGNKVIGGTKKVLQKTADFVLGGVEKEMKNAEKKDKENRVNAPVGAYGGTNKGSIENDIDNISKMYGKVKKGRSTSSGYMVR